MYIALLIFGALFNVAAQVLLKTSMRGFSFVGSVEQIVKNLITNGNLWISIMLYGIGFLMYAMALSKFDLSKAYPVSSVFAIILTVFISVVFMQESLSMTKVLGITFCLLGIIIIFR